MVGEYWNRTHGELIELALDTNHAVCGFLKGEIALAILKTRDDVDISPYVQDAKWVSYSLSDAATKGFTAISIPTGLSNEGLKRIGQGLRQARAPFGLRGLHTQLKQNPQNRDLQQALFRTDEWLAFQKIFGNDISTNQLLSLVLDLNWQQLSSCVELFKENSLEPLDPRRLLHQWVKGGSEEGSKEGSKKGSKPAAQVLAHAHRDWLCSELSDGEMLQVIQLLSSEDDSTVLLAVQLLKTPRKPTLWQCCREMLAARSKDESYLTLSHDALLQKLGLIVPSAKVVPSKIVVAAAAEANVKSKPVQDKVPVKTPVKVPLASSPSHTIYLVQKTQSLAAIAQSLKVSFIELKKLNPHLASSPRLAPGTAVKIPGSQATPLNSKK